MPGSERAGQNRAARGRECSAAMDMAHHPELWWEGSFGWAGVCEADHSCEHDVTWQTLTGQSSLSTMSPRAWLDSDTIAEEQQQQPSAWHGLCLAQ